MRSVAACLLVALALAAVAVPPAQARDLRSLYKKSKGEANAKSGAHAHGGYGTEAGVETETRAGDYYAQSLAGAYAANPWVQAQAEGYSHAAGYNPETNVKTTAEAYYGKAKSNTWGDASTDHYYGAGTKASADAGSEAKGYGAEAHTGTKTVATPKGAWSGAGSSAENYVADADAGAHADAYGPGAKAKTVTKTKVHHNSATAKSGSSSKSGRR